MVIAVVAVMPVMVAIAILALIALALAVLQSRAAEVETAIDLVLEMHERVGADILRLFEIAAAMPIGRECLVAAAVIDRRLRIGAQRPRHRGAERGIEDDAVADDLLRRDPLLDPVDERGEIGAALWPRPDIARAAERAERAGGNAAMPDGRCVEQAIEALHAFEARLVVMLAVARRHLAIVVEDAPRVDELIVAADEGHQLAAMPLELVEI